jgi:transcriptional regulator with XRE-family HTH domain
MTGKAGKAGKQAGAPLAPFARRLAALRLAAGLSAAALARRSGVDRPFLRRLEAGKTNPGWDTVCKLARGLGVSVAAFEETRP